VASELRQVAYEEWQAALEGSRYVDPRSLAAAFVESHGDLVAEARQASDLAYVMRMFKKFAHDEDASGGGQLSLFGFPAVISIPGDDGQYVQMQTSKATLAELRAGRLERVNNVRNAQVKLDQYDAGLEYVTPTMECDESMEFRVAIQRLAS